MPPTTRPSRARGWRRQLAMSLVALAAVTGVLVGDVRHAPEADAACSFNVSLGIGARGNAVRCVQSTLNARGFNSGPVDGAFGIVTYRAVVSYQRARGLYVDGIVGRQTGSSLGIWGSPSSGGATPAPAAPAAPSPSPPSSGGCAINTSLRLGSTGSQVRCLQATLNAAGYAVGPNDGQFGPMTYRGVRNYQRARGLIVDGIAGRQTGTSLGIWGSAAASGSTGSSGSSGSSGASTACTPPAGTPSSARQVVVVDSSGSRADVGLLIHDGSRWICARTDMPARVGRNGVRALSQRRSGDGTTPGGIFPLASMTAPDGQTFQFFGNGVNPGVLGTWRQVRAGDCWGATPGSADYNRLATRNAANCTSPDEYLPNFQGSYSRAALIGANMGPNRSGDGAGEAPLAAAIFLHRHSYDGNGNSRATSGCVSLGNDNLIYVLQRLRPGQAYFVIR